MKYFTKISSGGNEPAPSKSGLSPLSVGGDDGKDEFWRKFKEKAKYDRNVESLAQEGKGDQMSRVFTDRMATFSLPDPDPLLDLGSAQVNAFKYNKIWDPVGDKNNLSYLLKHKYNVFKAGREMDMPVGQLLSHDNSKFLPSEWMSYRNFFQNKGSNRTNSLSKKFRHSVDEHYSLNPHHIAYWGSIDKMPLEFKLEALADWYGVGKARGTEFDPDFKTWFMRRRNEHSLRMDENTLDYVQNLLDKGEKMADHKFIKEATPKLPRILDAIEKREALVRERLSRLDNFNIDFSGFQLPGAREASDRLKAESLSKSPFASNRVANKVRDLQNMNNIFDTNISVPSSIGERAKDLLMGSSLKNNERGFPGLTKKAEHKFVKEAWGKKEIEIFNKTWDSAHAAGKAEGTVKEVIKDTVDPKVTKFVLPAFAGAGGLGLGYAIGKKTPNQEEEYKMAEHKFIKEATTVSDKSESKLPVIGSTTGGVILGGAAGTVAGTGTGLYLGMKKVKPLPVGASTPELLTKMFEVLTVPGVTAHMGALAGGALGSAAGGIGAYKLHKHLTEKHAEHKFIKEASQATKALSLMVGSAAAGGVIGEAYNQSPGKGALAGAGLAGAYVLGKKGGGLDKFISHWKDLNKAEKKLALQHLRDEGHIK